MAGAGISLGRGSRGASAEAVRVVDLLEQVREKGFRLPTFQRASRWDDKDRTDLFDSIVRGFPIGTLIFWKKTDELARRTDFGGYTYETDAGSEARFVVDGQQRLSTLVSALLRGADEHGREMTYALDEGRFVYAKRGSGDANGLRVPVRLLADSVELLEWVREQSLDKDQQREVFDLSNRVREYRVSTFTLVTDDENDVRGVFDRVNRSGKAMTREEVFRGLFDGRPGDLFSLGQSIGEYGFGTLSEGTLLRMLLAVLGKPLDTPPQDLERGEVSRGTALIAKTLPRTIEFLRDQAGCPHFRVVASELSLLLLTKFFALFPQPIQRSITLLRRWYWRTAVFSPTQLIGEAPEENDARHLALLDAASEHGSIQRLLGLPRNPFLNLLESFSVLLGGIGVSPTAPVVLSLLSQARPRMLTSNGTLIDVASLLESTPRDDLFAGERSLGLTFVHPEFAREDLISVLTNASTEALRSHLVSEEAMASLRAGAVHDFVALREKAVSEFLKFRYLALAEPGHDDSPPLEALAHTPAA